MILSDPGFFPNAPQRIVSLVPSQTELLDYLGLEDQTIAITKFCVHPSHWKKQKTIIGGTKNIHLEKIIELQPDLIIANKEENVEDQIRYLAQLFPVWVSDVSHLPDALQMIDDIGKLTHTTSKASALINDIKAEFQLLSDLTPIRTAYLIWQKPYMTVGGDTFISHMLQLAGCLNVFADKMRYPEITIDDLKAANCQSILLSSEPYPFAQKHIETLQLALPGVRICLVDGELFSWYGSRLLQSPTYFKKLHKELRNTV